MASFNRKNYKRHANRVIRAINREYFNGPSMGRFYIQQVGTLERCLPDQSGRIYVVKLVFMDRATGSWDARLWDATYWIKDTERGLRDAMEEFTKKCGELPEPRDFRTYKLFGDVVKYPHSPHPGDAEPNWDEVKRLTWI